MSQANLAGPALLNSAQVEPRIGSPSHGSPPETVARRSGDVWRISGHKQYATGIPALKWVSVLAITDEPEPRLASFLVPTNAKGLHIVETWNAHRHAGDGEPRHHPRQCRSGARRHYRSATGGGRHQARRRPAWPGISCRSLRCIRARRAPGANWIADFAAKYTPGSLGQPIATLPRIQDGLGEIEIKLATNDRLLRTAAADADAGRLAGIESAAVKHQVIENAVAATTLALDLGGNPGLRRDNPLERHHRDVLCGRAHAPQNNMIRVMAAKSLLARLSGNPQAAAAATQPAAAKPKLVAVGG